LSIWWNDSILVRLDARPVLLVAAPPRRQHHTLEHFRALGAKDARQLDQLPIDELDAGNGVQQDREERSPSDDRDLRYLAAGLAVRAEAGFRFYASDHAFASLEGRNYRRLQDIHADVRRLAEAPTIPALSQRRGKRRTRSSR
jgi:hypothetical protein